MLIVIDLFQYKIRVSLDNVSKSFEFPRGSLSFNDLRSQVQSKHNITSGLNLRYHGARGEIYEVSNDQQLEKVLKDAMENGATIIELKIQSTSSFASSAPSSKTSTPSKPATSYSTPSHTPSSTPTKPQSFASPASSASPMAGNRVANFSDEVPAGSYHIVTWNIAGDSSSVNPKPKISYGQTSDAFTFWPIPCQHDAETRVLLQDNSKLVFESIYSFEDVSFGGQKGISTAKVTQTVGLPIKIAPNLIQVEGHKITINH